MNALIFRVNGIPVPKGSFKAFMRPGMKFPVITNANAKTKPWASLISMTATEAAKKEGWTITREAVSVFLSFVMPRPKGHYGTGKKAGQVKASSPAWPVTKKADLDKLVRCALDSLTGIVWVDDSQVCEILTSKHWAANEPGLAVTVREMNGDAKEYANP